jgi:hypothetical protein
MITARRTSSGDIILWYENYLNYSIDVRCVIESGSISVGGCCCGVRRCLLSLLRLRECTPAFPLSRPKNLANPHFDHVISVLDRKQMLHGRLTDANEQRSTTSFDDHKRQYLLLYTSMEPKKSLKENS